MPYRTTPQVEQRKAVVRGRIIAAARKFFAEQGYEASSVQQIVRDAGTSVGNFYFYFANKDALLSAVAEQFAGEVLAAVDEATSRAKSATLQLAALTYVSTTALLREGELASIASGTLQEQLAQRVRQVFESNPKLSSDTSKHPAAVAWQGVQSRILEAVLAGEIEGQPEEIARFIVGWNLRAIGLSARQVEEAVGSLGK